MGAMGLGDENMWPTKGQTVLVGNLCKEVRTRGGGRGEITYTIPRPDGGTILGGTMEVGKG